MSGEKWSLDDMIDTIQGDIDVFFALVEDVIRRIHLVKDPKDVLYLLAGIRRGLDAILAS